MNFGALACAFVVCGLSVGAPPPTFGELVPVDSQSLEIHRADGHWELWNGNHKLKDLGNWENDAKEALRILRELRVTQYGTIGTHRPVIEYWLSEGQAPVGLLPKLQLLTIDLQTMKIEKAADQWCIRDARQLLFNFGPYEEDAKLAFEMIKHYEFNRVGYVGRPLPAMMYFTSRPDPVQVTRTGTPRAMPTTMPLNAYQLQEAQYRQLSAPNSTGFDSVAQGDNMLFDWRQVQMKRDGQKWKLVLGSHTLTDFGPRETDAREAWRLFQSYRFTEQHRIGKATNPFTYYLVNGQPARGLPFGLRTTSFHSERLTIKQDGADWNLCEADVPVLRGGDTQAEAKLALQAVQKYKFDMVCQVGDGPAKMMFLLREH